MLVVRGSWDATINVLASCSRIEERAKRTSSVGPTRVCVTGGESAAFLIRREMVASPDKCAEPPASGVNEELGL